MNQTRAIAYARVSTLLKQEPEHQLVPIRGVIANRGFHLVGEYVDRVSGSSERRKELDQLVIDARMGKFNLRVFYFLNLFLAGDELLGNRQSAARNMRRTKGLCHTTPGHHRSRFHALKHSRFSDTPIMRQPKSKGTQ
jgi:hypothetical protein